MEKDISKEPVSNENFYKAQLFQSDRINYLEKKLKDRKFWDKVEPADVFAFMVIAGVLALNWKGVPTMLSQAVSIIIGFYFGHKMTQRTK